MMKLMVLLSRVPYPLDKGDKLRAYHQVKHLALKHDILLCCLSDKKVDDGSISHLKSFCSDVFIIRIRKWQILTNLLIGIFNKKPMQVNYFHNALLQKKVDKFIEKHMPAHIYCQLIRVTEYVKKYTIIPKTLDYMDAFSKGMLRRSEKTSWPLKLVYRKEASRLYNYERSMFAFFEHKTIISEQDKSYIDHPHREEIHVIPNGVDPDYFHPIKRNKEYELVFTGNMHYAPNVESACYLVKNILPILKKREHDVRLLISGTNPSREVRSLASDNVRVTGWVKNIRESYAISKIFIAAMQTGTGLQNKLLEANAMRFPAITSPLANNARVATQDEHILIGSSPKDYAIHIMNLLDVEKLYNKISINGHNYVHTHFIWESSVEMLNQIMFHKAEKAGKI